MLHAERASKRRRAHVLGRLLEDFLGLGGGRLLFAERGQRRAPCRTRCALRRRRAMAARVKLSSAFCGSLTRSSTSPANMATSRFCGSRWASDSHDLLGARQLRLDGRFAPRARDRRRGWTASGGTCESCCLAWASMCGPAAVAQLDDVSGERTISEQPAEPRGRGVGGVDLRQGLVGVAERVASPKGGARRRPSTLAARPACRD